MSNRIHKLTEDERNALRSFRALEIGVAEFLERMRRVVRVMKLIPGEREIDISAIPDENMMISRDDIRWVVQRYLHGKTGGEELSNWAGLLLAVPAYILPSADGDDDVLELMNDLALPLKEEYLDRDKLKARIAAI